MDGRRVCPLRVRRERPAGLKAEGKRAMNRISIGMLVLLVLLALLVVPLAFKQSPRLEVSAMPMVLLMLLAVAAQSVSVQSKKRVVSATNLSRL
jgi:uncharacterized membrane protein YcaP (DUF421 family)